jgi:hypothetical protein
MGRSRVSTMPYSNAYKSAASAAKVWNCRNGNKVILSVAQIEMAGKANISIYTDTLNAYLLPGDGAAVAAAFNPHGVACLLKPMKVARQSP